MNKVKINGNGYVFDLKKHIHTLDGIPLHGITTVLKVISKPALIQWAANMAVSHITERAEPYYGPDNDLKDYYIITGELLNEAKTAHRKKKETAGDWGTIVHLFINQWILAEQRRSQ